MFATTPRPPVRAAGGGKYSLHSDYDYRFKFLVIGDSGIGKSCLVERFSGGRFSESFVPTIGVDFKNRLLRTATGKKVKLHIWDTAGQERFKTVTTLFYRGAKAAVLCYDTTDRDSFEHLRTWLHALRTYAPTCRFMIAGTKTDLANAIKPEITNGKINDVWWNEREDAQALADELGVPLVRCSAKSGDGVEEVFTQLAESLVKDHVKKLGLREASNRKDTAAVKLGERTGIAGLCFG